MTEQQIRNLIRQEIARSNNKGRFDGVSTLPDHAHTGLDSPKIKAENIIPSVSVSGSISMTQETEYTLYLNSSFTPSHIQVYGTVVDALPPNYSGLSIRAITMGSANLTPSFYFQPNISGSASSADTSVVTGSIQYPFLDPNLDVNVPLQSCTYLSVEDGGTFHALTSEGHIISVEYPVGTIHARATVTSVTKDYVKIVVSDLDSGWSINANFIVT